MSALCSLNYFLYTTYDNKKMILKLNQILKNNREIKHKLEGSIYIKQGFFSYIYEQVCFF